MSALRSIHPTLRLFSKKVFNSISLRTYAEAGPKMPLTLAAANQVFYDKKGVNQVDVPTFSGAFGILPNHVPTLAVLKPGVVRIFNEDGTQTKVFVSSGIVSINDDSSVQVLAEEACPVENIDISAAREALSAASKKLDTAQDPTSKAEAEIALETCQAIIQAAEAQ